MTPNGFEQAERKRMGKPGYLRKPEGLTGPLAELNEELHRLHVETGAPSLNWMEQKLRGSDTPHSRSRIYDAFTKNRLPAWNLVRDLLRILAEEHHSESVAELLPVWHSLWREAWKLESSAKAIETLRRDHSSSDPTPLQHLSLPTDLEFRVQRHCTVCDQITQHSRLTEAEKDYVRELTGRRMYVDNLIVCGNPLCRAVRTFFNKKPLPNPSTQ
jgi:hypothetical protein